MQELNQERAQAGNPPLEVGIGVAGGPVVAGNMGSQDRLNYTVLGEDVNLAARLCSEAGHGEILTSDATRRAAGERARFLVQEPRELKGMSQPVRPWLVQGLASVGVPAGILLGSFGPTEAQDFLPDPPTLAEAGLGYISPSGFFQLFPSGRLDLALYRPGEAPPWLIPETEPFPAGHLQLVLDAFVGHRLYLTTELRADRGHEPSSRSPTARLQQAFLRLQVADRPSLHLQAGRFTAPYGNHPSRRRTMDEPFIRPPVHYDHPTVMRPKDVPGGVDGFLGWKEGGPDARERGLPPVWGTPYPVGAMLLGGHGELAIRLAVLNSAPASSPWAWGLSNGDFQDPTLTLHLGYQLRPELHLGGWYAQGPYIRRGTPAPDTPPGTGGTAEDAFRGYEQRLVGLEGTFTRGMVEIRGEAVRDVWQVPNVEENAVELGWFLEAKAKSGAGLYGAVRGGALHFGELAGDLRDREPWDYDVFRGQVAAGYRLARNLGIRGEYMRHFTDAPAEEDSELLSLELWWRF